MRGKFLTIIFVLLTFLSGCASTKFYSSSLTKNVSITKTTDSGSAFSSINIHLDIFDVNRACEVKYLGSVDLSNKSTLVGLPVNKNSLLSFRFEGSSFLGSSNSSTSFDTLLMPRKGYQYDVYARYVNGIYNVELFEMKAMRNNKRQIDTRELHECKRRH